MRSARSPDSLLAATRADEASVLSTACALEPPPSRAWPAATLLAAAATQLALWVRQWVF